jgi:oxalate decarboxylase/phosphoglucose isomerase-like protein (cupin superfamily)
MPWKNAGGGGAGACLWIADGTGLKTNADQEADGVRAIALGGPENQALGDYSYAEGHETTADGNAAHAEGYECVAGYMLYTVQGTVGAVVTVEEVYGDLTAIFPAFANVLLWDTDRQIAQATTVTGSTFGPNTDITLFVVPTAAPTYISIAQTQPAAHAEGQETTAAGWDAHAENYNTVAEGEDSHAEGTSTWASGTSSHSEGANTRAIGDGAHSEGYQTTAGGTTGHAEGYQCIAGYALYTVDSTVVGTQQVETATVVATITAPGDAVFGHSRR